MTLYMNKYKNATVQKKKDISEGIDVNKTSASKECDICHYWFLKMLYLNLKSMFVIDVVIY